jgi:hypothetical protein
MCYRWAKALPRTQWDRTGLALLEWADAPDGKTIPGFGNAFYQLVPQGVVYESVCVLPKPSTSPTDPKVVFADKGDINDVNRKMWVFDVGVSSFGET